MAGPWSVAPGCDTLTQEFGCVDNDLEWPDSNCASNRNHHGIDLAAWNVQGTPVYSARAGVVAAVGIQYLGPNAVCVLNDDGVYVEYGHMDTNTVNVGDRVEAGQQIGTVGNQGASTGPHLHVEARTDGPWQTQNTGPLVDPYPYLTVLASPKPQPTVESENNMVTSIVYAGFVHWLWVDTTHNVRHWFVNQTNTLDQGHDVPVTGAKVYGGVNAVILGDSLHITAVRDDGNLAHAWAAAGNPWQTEVITQ